MTASTATSPIPPAAKAELTSTGKLRAGINFQNVLLTTLGPNGEQGGVAVEFAHELARRLAVPLEIIPYKSAGAL
ncbi:MAG: ABC transporter substrate-binding protein, partial [Burkholderiales bacterium]